MTQTVSAAVLVVLAGCVIRALLIVPPRSLPAATIDRPSPGGPNRRFARMGRTAVRWAQHRLVTTETHATWPAVADEVAADLRSGASLLQALDTASARDGPVGARLSAVLRPVHRGAPLADAAGQWADSTDEPAEELVAQVVQLAATTGQAAPLLFDTVADNLRERIALAGEVRAQTAQARASGLALALLPLAFSVLLTMTDSSIPSFLLGSPAGWTCLMLGFGLQAAGAWWMHRIVAGVSP
jgi:tight adherence protein B